MSNHPGVAPTVDVISAAAIVGSLMHWLPPLAAVLAVVWYVLQIYESQTVQGWLHHRKVVKRLKSRHRRRVARRTPGSSLPPPHHKKEPPPFS
jgi:hypothetical protein